MNVQLGNGTTEYGPGVEITLTGDELALAVDAYLSANGITIHGPRTIRVAGEHCSETRIIVDPSGHITYGGR